VCFLSGVWIRSTLKLFHAIPFSVGKCRPIDNYAISDEKKYLNIDLITAHRLVLQYPILHRGQGSMCEREEN